MCPGYRFRSGHLLWPLHLPWTRIAAPHRLQGTWVLVYVFWWSCNFPGWYGKSWKYIICLFIVANIVKFVFLVATTERWIVSSAHSGVEHSLFYLLNFSSFVSILTFPVIWENLCFVMVVVLWYYFLFLILCFCN